MGRLFLAIFGLLIFLFSGDGKTLAAPQKRIFISDSLVTVVASDKYNKSAFYQLFWGKHYRKVWSKLVQVPVLNLQKEVGGLKPLQSGGSFQTKNLRLVNPQGVEYVIRSVDKDPAKALPARLQKTFIANLMRDQTSVIHPYGAYIIPPLAQAAGVFHTNPKLIVVPDDPALGQFRKEFAGMLALLEERPDGDQSEAESFGNSGKVVSSRKAFTKLVDNACHQVDKRQYLKSRLFDMWLGDWSRREDQWRWAKEEKNSLTIYRPIPRDRDHAFFKFNDGLVTWLASKIKTNYQTFGKNYGNNKGLNKSALPMDQFILASVPYNDYKQIADSLKMNLTDAVIKEALQNWPLEIYNLTGPEFENKLIARRNKLSELATEYYKNLAHTVLIVGSDNAERFKIEMVSEKETKVTVFADAGDCNGGILSERVYHSNDTKEIQVYGLGGNDKFLLAGKVNKGIKLKIFDGAGEDQIENKSEVNSRSRRTHLYLTPDGNTVAAGKGSKWFKKYKPAADEYSGAGWLLRHRLP